MVWRTVIVTRHRNIADRTQLQRHPNVSKVWILPWGYTLFEFYDPIFEVAYSLDPQASDPANLTPEIQSRVAALALEQRKLLGPLYAGRPEHWQGIQLGLPLKSAFYRVVDSQKISWPWFGCSGDWETERKIKVCGKLAKKHMLKSLAEVLATWVKWGTDLGEILKAEPVTADKHDFSVRCEFANPCGDACVALYTLTAATQNETSITAAGFFHPDEMSPRFAEIGGTGLL